MKKTYQEINMKTISSWINDGWEWGKPITHEQFIDAKHGEYKILLTPTKEMPKSWIKDIKDKEVLGLASGGAQQMPIIKALGGIPTCLDLNKNQIESERVFAKAENYDINLVCADMTKPLPFEDNSFDYIINPVSMCYIEDCFPIFKECYRVLKPGGYFISAHDNGTNYFVPEDAKNGSITLDAMPFNPLKNKSQLELSLKLDYGIQFSHSLEDVIGGQLKAGFKLLDIYEDYNDHTKEDLLSRLNIPTFYATRFIKE